MIQERWEHGSEFHWPSVEQREASAWPENARWFGSGRDALRALLRFGRTTRGWQRLLVPSYFCQEVVSAAREEIPVATYSDRPTLLTRTDPQIAVSRGDVALDVNFFGLRDGAAPNVFSDIDVIEDHTHDPWSKWAITSRAAFCIASLRKTLPVPDGGIVWSPRNEEMPADTPATDVRSRASVRKLAAMALKSLYLEGHAVEKDDFRALALAGEAEIASGPVSGIPLLTRTLLENFPALAWRAQRAKNHAAFSHALSEIPSLTVLGGGGRDVTPFSLILLLPNRSLRDDLKRRLVDARIYPAVLWPLDEPVVTGIADDDRDVAARMLSLHCDFRYQPRDIERVAQFVREAVQ